MADDESLRASLRGMSSDGLGEASPVRPVPPRPLEACLVAPPRAELEKLLGFSLDPATYEQLKKQKSAAPPVTEEAAPAAPLVAVDANPESMALPVEPEAIHSQVLPMNELDARSPVPLQSPPKSVAEPLSPGSPVP